MPQYRQFYAVAVFFIIAWVAVGIGGLPNLVFEFLEYQSNVFRKNFFWIIDFGEHIFIGRIVDGIIPLQYTYGIVESYIIDGDAFIYI